ncbi:MAG: glucose-1-phosphate adenylyltransferase [Acidobacteria bacterium]|nr:glucose-1-phosphate adenylyltransferase [Acidobacteriota bacterium]
MASTGPDRRSLHPESLKRVLTFVLAGGKGERLYPLTRDRSKPAVPFGGTYRIIDFTLSNCMNSGLRRIYLLIQYKSASLMRHVTQGWSIYSAELGEYIYTVPPQLRIGTTWYLGTADAIYQNIYTLEEERPEHVMILSGDHIYRMDYREMLAEHLEQQADATLAVLSVPAREANRFGVVEVDPAGVVVGFREKPKDIDPSGPDVVANMGVYLFRTESLVQAVCRDARRGDSSHDFGHDVLPSMVRGGARVFAHRYRGAGSDPRPYWRDIGTVDAYFDANMDLISVTPQFNLYDPAWPIRSAPIQAAPAKFVFAGGEAGRIGTALDSLVSTGVIISGGHVERSILGPYCRINSWSQVSDSILMDGVVVGRHAIVRRAIVDKRVVIPAGARIGVDHEADSARFTVTPEGLVLIPKGELLDAPALESRPT